MSDVTCLMITRGRPQFALLAAINALEQTYPCRLLVVCDNIEEDFPFDLGATVLQAPTGDIKAKRLWTMKQIDTEYVAIWDDDNTFEADRVAIQRTEIGDKQAHGSIAVKMVDLTEQVVYASPWNKNFPHPASIFTRAEALRTIPIHLFGPGAFAGFLHKQHHKDLQVTKRFCTTMMVHGDNMSSFVTRPLWKATDETVPAEWLAAYESWHAS